MKNLRVAYSRGTSLISRIIRLVTRKPVNHTLFLADIDGIKMVIEADWNGLVVKTLENWKKGSGRIYDTPPLVKDLDEGIPLLLKLLDEPYDYAGLLGMAWVKMGQFWFHRRWKNPLQLPKALFCSEVAAVIFQAVNYPGAKELDPGSTDPGTLRDWQYKALTRPAV